MKKILKNIKASVIIFGAAVFGIVFVSALPAKAASINEAHPSGVLIDLGDANHTILLIENNKGVGIPSPSVFYSHGFSFDKVVPANKYDPIYAASVMKYADGTIVNENGTIYIIGDSKKRGFTKPEIFKELGYSFEKSSIIVPEDSYRQALSQYEAGIPISSGSVHPEGALIQSGNDIYLLKNSRRIGIPSMDIFNSYGFKLNNVVSCTITDLNEYKFDPYNSGDIMKFRDGTLVLDTTDNRTVYVISDGKKRGITSQEALESYGYKWGNIKKGNLSNYSSGNTITLFDNTNTAVVGSVQLAGDSPSLRNIEKGAENVELAKFQFLSDTSYTIKKLVISRNSYLGTSDYLLDLYDGDEKISSSSRYLVAGKAEFSNLHIEVSPSKPKTISVRSRLFNTTALGDKISLSLISSYSVETVSGIVGGSFPIQGSVMTVVEPNIETDFNDETGGIYKTANFVLYTDLNDSDANEFLKFFEAFKKYFEINYFTLTQSQGETISVIIYKDPNDYYTEFEIDEDDDYRFGFNNISYRMIVSHKDSGLGTYANFISTYYMLNRVGYPSDWFSIGFPRFFEKFIGYYDDDYGLKIMEGLPNPWRREQFVSSIDSNNTNKPTVRNILEGNFKTSVDDTNRLLTEYLHEKKRLKLYAADRAWRGKSYVENADDGMNVLTQTLGMTESQLEADWSIWIDNVIATTKSGQINSVPASFVLENKQAWDAWWATNSGSFSWINNLRIE